MGEPTCSAHPFFVSSSRYGPPALQYIHLWAQPTRMPTRTLKGVKKGEKPRPEGTVLLRGSGLPVGRMRPTYKLKLCAPVKVKGAIARTGGGHVSRAVGKKMPGLKFPAVSNF